MLGRRLDGRPKARGARAPAGAWLRRVALSALLLYAAAFGWTGRLIAAAEAAFFAGRLDEAHEELGRAAFWRARGGRVADALGVVDLARGRLDEARGHLGAARGAWFHSSGFGERRILKGFLKTGRLEAARLYAEHRAALGGSATASFHLGVALDGLNRLDEAERALAGALAADPGLASRVAARRERLAVKRRTGRDDSLFDVAGAPLGGRDLASGRPVWPVPTLQPALAPPWGPRLPEDESRGRVELTLDAALQRAAEQALGARKGAIVLIDPASGALRAAVGVPAAMSLGPRPAPTALVRGYEPGSIIKMLTLTAALRMGVDVDSHFPLDCPGWIEIDGKAFRDWMPHRRVESIDEAVAVSCNIAFARLGAEVGRDRLDAELRRFFLDAPEQALASVDFGFQIGSSLPADATRPAFALARRAVGLDSLRITPLGAALIAAGLARGGDPPAPYMIERRLDLLMDVTYSRPPAPADPDPLDATAAALVRRVMLAAVARPDGTARRAAVEGLPAAMKTGTSGTNPPGLDAIVIGFVPAEKPVLAFAVVAEAAGKAELEGARITGELMRRIESSLLRPLPPR